ncbi:MAG: AAA family ATPase [Planctomycetaceae bacterium]|nr:AAA family ATPase [Planctomycetaceae bacterium]
MLRGFWIRNFKSLRQVGIGSCYPKFVYIEDETEVLPYGLERITLLAGKSGTGKSTVVDAFNFVSDCYKHGVGIACLKRGGFDDIYSQGGKGSITFGFQFQQKGEEYSATYAISIYRTKNKIPYIESEVLAYQRGQDSQPIIFIQNGAEKSIRYLAPDKRLTNAELTQIEFVDHNHLGLAALAAHPKYPVVASFRALIENWTLCDFTPDPARGLDKSLPRRHDSAHGLSLSGLVRYVATQNKDNLKALLLRVATLLPNVERISLDNSDPTRPLLAFHLFDRNHPISISHLSAATIRLFTYALLMEEDFPASLSIIDEPENGLDREHREKFVQELNSFGRTVRTDNPQFFVSTHHPAIADGFHPAQVWIFDKDRDGFTAVERASDSMVFQLDDDYNNPKWYSVFFDEER